MNENKIGILTIIDNNNYGNRLQNYATQSVLKSLDLECETIKNYVYTNNKKNFLLRVIKNMIMRTNTFSNNDLKKQHFIEFNKNIVFSKKRCTAFSKPKYKYVIVGSDQVWNPNYGRLRNVDLLNFVDSKKRISFAASFGIGKLPTNYTIDLKKSFMEFKAISVREENGYKIINELTGRKDVSVLIDPTLMLHQSEWLELAKIPEGIDFSKPYILTYFLGNKTDRVNEDLKIYSEQINANIYHLLDCSQQNLFVSGPSEFIYLIANAKLVLTDSFHGCVFSFLFKKPFLVYQREGENTGTFSRMDTLLTKFDLKRKFADSGIENELLEADYETGYIQLEKERKKSINFLKESMDLE